MPTGLAPVTPYQKLLAAAQAAGLTERQQGVLICLTEGFDVAQTATLVGVSEETAQRALAAAAGKLVRAFPQCAPVQRPPGWCRTVARLLRNEPLDVGGTHAPPEVVDDYRAVDQPPAPGGPADDLLSANEPCTESQVVLNLLKAL
jgi:hypothetical protein